MLCPTYIDLSRGASTSARTHCICLIDTGFSGYYETYDVRLGNISFGPR